MDYRKIRIPFLNNSEIRKRADSFRSKFWDKSVPVNIEEIVDLKLKINLVPIPGLQRLCDTDALITSNWRLIYIDKDRYIDERFQNRLRFSLAHEIGHFVLHKNIYNSFKIKTFEDFYRLIDQIPQEQYNYLESQANKFANYLLVARDRLIIAKNKVLKVMKDKSVPIERMDKSTINSYISIPISKIFGVSEDVIQIALGDLDK